MPEPLISTVPHWPLPSAKRMRLAKIGVKLCEHFESNYVGLREIKIFVQKVWTPDGPTHGDGIQRLELAPRRKPPTFQDLCRITWLRAERFVRQQKAKTQFRVHFIGEEDGKPFNRQCRFTIETNEVLDDDLEAEDQGDGTDDDGKDGKAEGTDQEGDKPNEEEDEDDKANWSNDGAAPNALVPLEERIEPSGQRHVIPQTINPHFITHVQRDTLELAHRAYSGPMKENRLLVQEMRHDTAAFVRDLKSMAEMLLNQSMNMRRLDSERHDKQVTYMQTRMESLEKQQIESNKLNYRQYENLQELAKQGWVAFLDAMRMKSEVVDERIEWARFIKEEAEQAQPVGVAVPQESGAGSLIREASKSPLLIGGLSIILRKAGNEEGATLLEGLAKDASKRQGVDEDEDEDEDDETIDVDATEHPNDTTPGNGQPPGQSGPFVGHPSAPPQHAAPTPFADRVRAFRGALDKKSFDGMRQVLSKRAWNAFEKASRAMDDRVTIEAITTMDVELSKDKLALLQLMEHLTETQMEAIATIVEDVKKVRAKTARRAAPRRPPPRPGPAAPSE